MESVFVFSKYFFTLFFLAFASPKNDVISYLEFTQKACVLDLNISI